MSKRYDRTTIDKRTMLPILWAIGILAVFVLGVFLWYAVNTKQELISPLGDNEMIIIETIIVKKVYPETLDGWVDEASEKFAKGPARQSIMKAKLHFLLSKESKHGNSEACGDSGLACGPMQFHQGTWLGYRKLMIKEGVADEIGDRLDMKQAIFTTAWAIADGRELAWGPLARGEIKL